MKTKNMSPEELNKIWVQFATASVAGLSAVWRGEDGGLLEHKTIIHHSIEIANEMTEKAEDNYESEQEAVYERAHGEALDEAIEPARKEIERLVELLRLSDMALDTAEAHLPVAEGNKLAIQEIVSARKKLKQDIKYK